MIGCQFGEVRAAVRGRRLGPGSVLLVEDTAGKGHLTRCLRDRLAVLLPLAEGVLTDAGSGARGTISASGPP